MSRNLQIHSSRELESGLSLLHMSKFYLLNISLTPSFSSELPSLKLQALGGMLPTLRQ